VHLEVAGAAAEADDDGRATMLAVAGFQVLRSSRPGAPHTEQPLSVTPAARQSVTVPVDVWLYAYADAVAVDESEEAVERLVWLCADSGHIPEGCEPVRGALRAPCTEGGELMEELTGGSVHQGVRVPIERISCGDLAGGATDGAASAEHRPCPVCPLCCIRLEPAGNMDYSWHPKEQSPLAERIGSHGGCEFGRLLRGEPVAMGSLRPTVRVECPSGRTVRVDVKDCPTVAAAVRHMMQECGVKGPALSLQQNGRVLDSDYRLGRCHGGPVLTAIALTQHLDP